MWFGVKAYSPGMYPDSAHEETACAIRDKNIYWDS
jgi:hypothetical protein